jgi:hypothetical protein
MSTISMRVDGAGNIRQGLEIEKSGIGAGTGHDHPGAVPPGQAFHLVVVDGFRLPVYTVVYKMKKPAGKADPGTVGQVSAVGQIHAQYRVTRFQ